ncbi:hypothetical protein [Haloarcula sp. 1CSR25-25]|jgi:hypothetical protein|uniref:DUF7847 domain-containing protein n=1 Tax=Haloarcula sp. 1CSR25-25 TaxID=2862545 RepID=UPI0028950010|nr:hypothetical protein [Haloarcula sp. 1CSR25-25]MDT3437709.1 hypothetical protein [Haloarcula sp. 1CSR25-25]
MTNSSPVLSSLRQTPKTLTENPVVFLPVVIVMALQLPQVALPTTNPVLSGAMSLGVSAILLLVMPFLQGGLIGMADEALDGRTTIQTFVAAGKSNYVSILVAYIALMAVNFALGILVLLVAVFGGAVALQGGMEAANTTVLVGVGIAASIVVFAYLLLTFFAQFYGQAIVLENRDVVDGFKRSVSVVRHHLVSTLGYSLIGVVISVLAGGLFAVASSLISPQSTPLFALPEPSLPIVVGTGLAIVVGGILFGGFSAVYSVSFYRTITQKPKAVTA